jgi:hypothetical protein
MNSAAKGQRRAVNRKKEKKKKTDSYQRTPEEPEIRCKMHTSSMIILHSNREID